MSSKKHHKTIPDFILLVLFTAIAGFFLSRDGGYCLLYREQQQLFLYDWTYIWGLLGQRGGFALLLSRYIVQFFTSPFMAVTLTFLMLSTGLLASLLASRSLGMWRMLSAVPFLIICLLLEDIQFNYEVAAALCIGLPIFLALISTCIKNFKIGFLLCLPTIALMYITLYPRNFKDEDAGETAYQYEYLVAAENWDELEKISRKKLYNYSDANYYHLARAMKGELAQSLFNHPLGGPLCIVFIAPDKSSDVRLAHIMYTMGNIAAAQDIAFNTLHTPRGLNPSMLKMNTKIELMRGEYAVARKYLEILKKSWRYSSWANSMSRFLDDDAAVKSDPELGRGRRDFPKSEGFAMYGSPMDELLKILESNTSDKVAAEYGLSYLLAAKDINHCFEFIDRFFGCECMQILPKPAQEALVFFSEYYSHMDRYYLIDSGLSAEDADRYKSIDKSWCLSHGVDESIYKSFEGFQQAQMSGNMAVINSTYAKTFWKYLIYSQI